MDNYRYNRCKDQWKKESVITYTIKHCRRKESEKHNYIYNKASLKLRTLTAAELDMQGVVLVLFHLIENTSISCNHLSNKVCNVILLY